MAESPAYQYGRVLGAFQEGYRRMFEDIARGMKDAVRAANRSSQSTHDLMMTDPVYRREYVSKKNYEAKVALEKKVARIYLTNLIREERAFWGLS